MARSGVGMVGRTDKYFIVYKFFGNGNVRL